MPMTPFIGVRISWLMLARNSLLARLAASAASREIFSDSADAMSSAVREATRSSRVWFDSFSSNWAACRLVNMPLMAPATCPTSPNSLPTTRWERSPAATRRAVAAISVTGRVTMTPMADTAMMPARTPRDSRAR